MIARVVGVTTGRKYLDGVPRIDLELIDPEYTPTKIMMYFVPAQGALDAALLDDEFEVSFTRRIK